MSTTPPSVLLIDDELPICTSVCGMLQMTGFSAQFATDADQGFEQLRNDSDIDIVLLDVNLGRGMSGLDALRKMKDINKYLQVIMFTSQDSLEIGLESMKRGAIDFLAKPFDLKLFTKIAATAIERKKIEQVRDLYFDMVIHDLKNPLQVISSSHEMLNDDLKDMLSPIQKKLLDVAGSGVKQLQMIIGNVIGITNFEKNSLIARHEAFNIKDALSCSLNIFESMEIIYNQSSELLCTDRDLLIRVITNLVSNAQRFALPGTPVIVKLENVINADIQISVKNTGSFIEPEVREIVFDKFLSIHSMSRSVRGQNFGLGLTFSKFAVEAMGGRIWIEGDRQKPSTTFKFTVNNYRN